MKITSYTVGSYLFTACGIKVPGPATIVGDEAMATVDLQVGYLAHDGPVEHQLTRVAFLAVRRAARAVTNSGLDALAAERVPAPDRDYRLAEDSVANRT